MVLSEKYKKNEGKFDEALAQEQEKQKPSGTLPFSWNSDKDEENMQRFRNAAKWNDK